MRRSSTFVSSFPLHILLLSCFLLTLNQSSAMWKDRDADLVDQICKKTPFYDLCSSILHSNPLSPNTDPKGMALIMVNDILTNATDTLSYIEQLIKQTSDPQLEQELAFCAESYIPVVKYILPQAADAISQGRFGFASYCISDAEKEVDACNKKFSDSSQSPISDRNSIMQKLVDVAAAIVKLLLHG
ncbi:cell wall / vacuolar inhibitor of fructosidase 1-like [Gastrolobium bilobum]|uniref:cell wall / vacuolar inhibitor of fructosidase 1-like n=1 Tax=Gastrolobium bilobum TaxID=150636 RepID=UPI002AB08E80|nr:cell wall / vacuolar inhibitor of fructosidase 1-like [Gastrolobium bilobum]